MQDHWLEVAPPTYITSAAAVGYKSQERQGESDEMIEDPQQLALALSSIPGGSIM